MKKFFTVFVPLSVAVLCLLCIYIFRLRNAAPVWKNYRVLCVHRSVSEKSVLTKLESLGIYDTVTLKNQTSFGKSMFCPVVPFEQDYVDSFSPFFFDESGTYQIYYLPINVDLNKKLEKLFSQESVDNWKLENVSTISYWILLIPVVVSIFFFITGHKKFLFFIMQVPFLYLSFFSPQFYEITVSVLFSLIAFYIQHFFKKPDWIKFLLTDPVFLLLIVAFAILPFFSGIKSFLLIYGTLLVSVSFFFLYLYYYQKSSVIKYIYIASAKTVSFTLRQKSEFLFIGLCSFFIISGFFFLRGKIFSAGGLDGLSIPCPKEYNGSVDFSIDSYESLMASKTEGCLADLSDYVLYKWKKDIFPFVSMNRELPPAKKGSSVFYQHYKENVDEKRIRFSEENVFTFNNDYVTTKVSELDQSKEATVEKLLFEQKKFIAVCYDCIRK